MRSEIGSLVLCGCRRRAPAGMPAWTGARPLTRTTRSC